MKRIEKLKILALALLILLGGLAHHSSAGFVSNPGQNAVPSPMIGAAHRLYHAACHEDHSADDTTPFDAI